ncbi:MAG: type II secretion system F family protein, partial [Thermodesulfovibrionales bacterium]
MPATFQWSGKTVKGTIESGELVANSKDEVIAQLKRRSITPTIVTEKAGKAKFNFSIGGGKVKDKDIVIFTRQFATMIDAGLPLVQGL